jgi:hypothetical protein
MITPHDYRKEIAAFAGGVVLAYLIACLLGVSRSLFSSPASAGGAVILYAACRSFVSSLYQQVAAQKAKTDVYRSAAVNEEA